MIKLGKLRFGNCLPFGDNIEIDLAENVTTQLVGKNGSGKSSIPLILEEVLYNKNSKGVAKGDILNRYTDAKEYWIKLDFEVDGISYLIEKVVKTTAKVTLTSNGKNIGGHTATQTYKIIAEILGMDMTTFSKLVYQSLNSSLDFLTATDGNRKKFLINLLNLEKYPLIEARIKESRKDLVAEVAKLTKSRDNLQATLKGTVIPDLMVEQAVPETLSDRHTEILELTEIKSGVRNDISNLEERAKVAASAAKQDEEIKRHQLQEWIRNENACLNIDRDISNIDERIKPNAEALDAHFASLSRPQATKLIELASYVADLGTALNKIRWEMDETKKLYKTFSADAAETVCTACNSQLDKAHAAKESEKQKQIFIAARTERDIKEEALATAKVELDKLTKEQEAFDLANKQATIANAAVDQAEKALAKKQADLAQVLNVPIESVLSAKPTSSLLSAKPTIDFVSAKPTINIEEDKARLTENITALDKKIAEIRQAILQRDKEIERAQEHNIEVAKNNMKREILQETFNKASDEVKSVMEELNKATTRLVNVDVLVKVFGAKGLIAYKLESCVKVFENKVNQYLSEVSNGIFALGFELDEANLKVVVYSSGKQVNIKTLSSGELSKVNISTLLSIRSLMSSVSKNSLNALFLDEVVSTIDEDGMEDLISVLIKEHNLNTFVVSHNYQHPLVEVLKVVKENKISRLEHGDWS